MSKKVELNQLETLLSVLLFILSIFLFGMKIKRCMKGCVKKMTVNILERPTIKRKETNRNSNVLTTGSSLHTDIMKNFSIDNYTNVSSRLQQITYKTIQNIGK